MISNRPLIDLDLGHACQYGYRNPRTGIAVHRHAVAPTFDLRAARIAAGFTQAALAARIGASPQCVRRWDRGAPCPEMYRLRWHWACQRWWSA